MGTVKEISDRVILLEGGKILKDGLPDEVVDFYNAKIAERENSSLSIEQRRQKSGWLHTEFGNRKAYAAEMKLYAAETDREVVLAQTGDILEVRGVIEISEALDSLVIGHRLSDKLGHVVFGTNTWHHKRVLHDLIPGQTVYTCFRFACELGPGSYSVSFGVHQTDTHLVDCFHKADNHIVFDIVNADKPFFIGSSYLEHSFDVSLTPLSDLKAAR